MWKFNTLSFSFLFFCPNMISSLFCRQYFADEKVHASMHTCIDRLFKCPVYNQSIGSRLKTWIIHECNWYIHVYMSKTRKHLHVYMYTLNLSCADLEFLDRHVKFLHWSILPFINKALVKFFQKTLRVGWERTVGPGATLLTLTTIADGLDSGLSSYIKIK